MLPPWGVQVCQVLALLVFAPVISGVIAKAEARVQWRRGPSIFQPYCDIWKFFRKESVRPETASPFFELAPLIAFASYCSIALLIPVLTNFPLPLGTAGDILGGALLFGLVGFVTALAGVDSGSVYAALGSSRTQSVATLVEPTLIFVFFTVALVTGTDLPYALNATLSHSSSEYFRPSHLLAAAASSRCCSSTRVVLCVVGVQVPVWASGVAVSGRRVQYTAIGYANMVRVIFNVVYRVRTQLRTIGDQRFPERLSMMRAEPRLFDPAWLYRPITGAFTKAADAVRTIQAGPLGLYLLYVLLAFIALLLIAPRLG